MGLFIILFSTAIVVLIISLRNKSKNLLLFNLIKLSINNVNRTYLDFFKDKSFLITLIQGFIIIFAEVSALISLSTSIWRYFFISSNVFFNISIKMLLIIFFMLIVHYSIGYIVYILTSINKFLYNVEDKNLKIDLLLSYFIISSYSTAILIFPKQISKIYLVGLLGCFICYALNIKILIRIMKNPKNIKSKNQNDVSFTRIIIASIILIIMIILNLYLAVVLINSGNPHAFTNKPTNFDLFYFTLITFTTVGYGDIIPITGLAKIVTMFIAVTSVICISIFISSILSHKDLSN
ncbi:MAG: potassium channel family protein [Sarcina ventriculi]|nr:potassium channel family protein [Sarcina ventriculi]MDY7063533.1 potassium channel family protein [Sarcina ventriculi]